MHIAVLESDPAQLEYICQTLTRAGHVCHPFAKGLELIHPIHQRSFDLLVLDSGVSDMAGDEALRWVRRCHAAKLPVLFTTVLCSDANVASMLNNGADDYVVKPVPPDVLLARVDALLRRAYRFNVTLQKRTFGNIEFDLDSKQMLINGRSVSLTHKEFDLALLFFEHLNRPLSRTRIIETLWKRVSSTMSRSVDTQVSTLRTKLGLHSQNGYRLASIYGYGYRLERTQRS